MVNGNKLDVRTSIFEDILQSLLLLLAVGQNIQFIAFQQIILQGGNEQFEVLVEERLRSDFAMHGGLRLPFHPRTEAHFAEALHICLQLRSRQQFPFRLHLLQNLFLLHLRNPFEPFSQCLLGETFAIDAVHGIGDKAEILGSQDGMLRQKTDERNQFRRKCSQFGYNLHCFAPFPGELALHFKRAY